MENRTNNRTIVEEASMATLDIRAAATVLSSPPLREIQEIHKFDVTFSPEQTEQTSGPICFVSALTCA